MRNLNRNHAALAAALSFAVTTFVGPAVAQTITVAHAKGDTVVPAIPRNVAVFDIASLDILDALGVDGVTGVPKGADGKGNFPPSLTKFSDGRYRNVGTLFEPDTAALTAMKPDLIILGGRSGRAYDAVKSIAPTLDMTSLGQDVAETTIRNTRTFGKMFNVEARAEQKIAAFQRALEQLHAQAAGAGTGLVVVAAGENIMAQGPGERFGAIYDFVGIRSSVAATQPAPRPARDAAESPAGRRVRPTPGSPEAAAAAQRFAQALQTAVATDPTWLIVMDRDGAIAAGPSTIAQRLGANPQIAATAAFKAGRVIYVDPKTWYLASGGIAGLTKSAIDTLAALQKRP